MGRPEAVQCVEKFGVSRGLGFGMIPQYCDELWFSPRRREACIVSALLLSRKGAEELPNSRMHGSREDTNIDVTNHIHCCPTVVRGRER